MTNKARRKINRIAYTTSVGHITHINRIFYKWLDGKPIRTLTKDECRFWAKVNRYCRQTGKPREMARDMLAPIAA